MPKWLHFMTNSFTKRGNLSESTQEEALCDICYVLNCYYNHDVNCDASVSFNSGFDFRELDFCWPGK